MNNTPNVDFSRQGDRETGRQGEKSSPCVFDGLCTLLVSLSPFLNRLTKPLLASRWATL
jgi:hypothetical protein